ncbi:protein FAR1-RELATED SEQUENCE 5-like [Panicum virgatum]|uniref:protein FAR1-RELATED SEQUENCE 5-like n=1 Tax=Panicum virgatum TaxID=38727 RepID=UPI0019D66C7C|nr:protein FAR1-RELATED SEQUENCE 5-like [Panicum virgatum]
MAVTRGEQAGKANVGMAKEQMADLESLLEYNEIVRKMFANEYEGFQFYNAYALGKGFTVRKSYVEWNSDRTELTLRRYICSRHGCREEKYVKKEIKQRRPRDITRVGCPAKLVIAVDRNTGQWYVKDFIDQHNHPLAPTDLGCLLRSHRTISDEQKAEIVELGVARIRKHQIFEIMEMQYGGYDKVGYTSRDLYNFCHLYKQEIIAGGDAQTVISHLTEPFGDVVVFDSTYKTNRYNLPLVPFVGANHHYRTILFGCGIISHENIESYVWLLITFTEANVQKHHVSVITDGDLAMQMKEEFRIFMYDLCSIEEIERKWQAFLSKHEVTEDSWLYQMYEHYESCLTKVRRNEADDDANALQSEPFTEPDASILEINAKKRLMPNVFKAKVQFSVQAAKKCSLIEILDGDDTTEYIVGRIDRDIMNYVKCELSVEANLKGISCSCHKLQSLGTPCSHIFFGLGFRDESMLPDCCVLESLTAAFIASRSTEGYERIKRVLEQEAAVIMPNAGANEGKMYGPVLPQAPEVDCEEFRDVLDPMHVPGIGPRRKS